MYTMLVFRSPRRQLIGPGANESHDRYHNALLIASHTYQQYYKITKDSRFQYNNEIPLIARGVNFMIPFSVVAQREDWNRITKTSYTGSSSGATLDSVDMYDTIAMDASSSSATSYHAILSLDRYSSIWDHYNVMTLTPYYMTLRYEASGLVTNTIGKYGGLTKLLCNNGQNASDDDFNGNNDNLLLSDRCVVSTTERLIVGDGTVYNRTAYRLIIDLHSAANYLPVHLYFHLQSLKNADQTLTFMDSSSPGHPLILNNNFNYKLNEYDNDIIIGVDLLHLFPKIELSMESGEINLWYFHTPHIHNDRQEAVSVTLTFIVILCLGCYLEFICNDPGSLFRQLIRYSGVTVKWFYFSIRQVLVEILISILALLIMLLNLAFSDFNTTCRFQRTTLFSILTLYHVIILAIVLKVTPNVTRQAFKYYFQRNKKPIVIIKPQVKVNQSVLTRNFLGLRAGEEDSNRSSIVAVLTENDYDYEKVKDSYIEKDKNKLSKEETINVIARSTCMINLILLSIMMKLNFTSEESYLYLLMLFIAALIFLYYAAHYTTLGWLYWLSFTPRKVPLSYLLFICGELICLVLYVTWSIPIIYMDYLHAINSIYTEAFIIAITFVLIGFIILSACRSYHTIVTETIQSHYVIQS